MRRDMSALLPPLGLCRGIAQRTPSAPTLAQLPGHVVCLWEDHGLSVVGLRAVQLLQCMFGGGALQPPSGGGGMLATSLHSPSA
jgi:hypothetical protein